MAGIEARSFESPDETRQFHGHGHAEVVQLHGQTVLRSVFEPGWTWKADIGPLAGTATCQTRSPVRSECQPLTSIPASFDCVQRGKA